MKKRWAALILVGMHSFAFADSTLPAGAFGLDFTDNPNTAVFSVAGSADNIKITSVADQSVYAGTEMTAEKKKKLWEKLSWSDTAFEAASCISFEREAICHIAAEQKKANSDLSALKSDYFHYDPMGGVVSAFPLK